MARDKLTLQKVAVKAIIQKELKNFQQFINEVNILIKMDHPNIINIIEIWEWDNIFFVVTDYYEGGELYNYILKNGPLDESEAFKIVKQMASILLYFHDHNIVHADLKPE